MEETKVKGYSTIFSGVTFFPQIQSRAEFINDGNMMSANAESVLRVLDNSSEWRQQLFRTSSIGDTIGVANELNDIRMDAVATLTEFVYKHLLVGNTWAEESIRFVPKCNLVGLSEKDRLGLNT